MGCELAWLLIFPLLPAMTPHLQFSRSPINSHPWVLFSYNIVSNLTLPDASSFLAYDLGLNLLALFNFDTFNQDQINDP
jgi:hypothetical protein